MSEGADLRYFYGPMESGKSALLLQQVHALRSKQHELIVIKPERDTKDGHLISSRAIEKKLLPDIIIPTAADLRKHILGYIALNDILPRRIISDESQFYPPEQIEGLWELAKRDGIPVDAYGLGTDFQGRLFPGSKRLFELADELEVLRTQYCRCGSSKPNFNIRLYDNVPIFEGAQVAVDGSEDRMTYETVCGSCFLTERDKYELQQAEMSRVER